MTKRENCIMSSDSQLTVPPSFLALYTHGMKLALPREEVIARYELCEDLATVLTEQAKSMQFQLGVAESDVLDRCLAGLSVPDSVVSSDEAQWVVTRLAELLDWTR